MENDNHEEYGNPRNTGRRGLQVEAKTTSLLWPHSSNTKRAKTSNSGVERMPFVTMVNSYQLCSYVAKFAMFIFYSSVGCTSVVIHPLEFGSNEHFNSSLSRNAPPPSPSVLFWKVWQTPPVLEGVRKVSMLASVNAPWGLHVDQSSTVL